MKKVSLAPVRGRKRQVRQESANLRRQKNSRAGRRRQHREILKGEEEEKTVIEFNLQYNKGGVARAPAPFKLVISSSNMAREGMEARLS